PAVYPSRQGQSPVTKERGFEPAGVPGGRPPGLALGVPGGRPPGLALGVPGVRSPGLAPPAIRANRVWIAARYRWRGDARRDAADRRAPASGAAVHGQARLDGLGGAVRAAGLA